MPRKAAFHDQIKIFFIVEETIKLHYVGVV